MQKKTGKPQKTPALSLDQFKAETEKRAKEIYLKRQETGKPGDAVSDWLAAEEEVKRKHHIG